MDETLVATNGVTSQIFFIFVPILFNEDATRLIGTVLF